jgi:hypothetical protein
MDDFMALLASFSGRFYQLRSKEISGGCLMQPGNGYRGELRGAAALGVAAAPAAPSPPSPGSPAAPPLPPAPAGKGAMGNSS